MIALPEELAAVVLNLIRPKPGGGISELLEYQEQTAGRLMNPNVFALSEDLTAGEAITALQKDREVEMVFYLYVVDERRHLVGVVSLRRLLLVAPDTPLKRIMTTEVYSARVDVDQEEVARQVASYNLLAMPVVDVENKLVGVITVDDVIDIIKDEATEDVLRLAGVSREDGVQMPPKESLRRRLPWLLVNLATAFLAAFVIGRFEDTLKAAVTLSFYHAGRGGHGRQRGDADARGHRSRHRTGRVDLEQRPPCPDQRRTCRHRQWRSQRPGGCARSVRPDQGGLGARPDPDDGHDRQHVRGGDGRHPDSAGASCPQGRPGDRLLGLHHHFHGRVRVLHVPRPRNVVHSLPAPPLSSRVNSLPVGPPRKQTPNGRRAVYHRQDTRQPREAVFCCLVVMRSYSGDALILRTYRYGEADRIVVFLTEDRGKKRGVAKNATKSRRRFGAALEPLTRGRATYVEHETRDLVRLERVEPRTSPLRATDGTGHASRPRTCLGHAAYFAELLDEWAPENAANERLFRLGASVGEALCASGESSRWPGTSSTG